MKGRLSVGGKFLNVILEGKPMAIGTTSLRKRRERHQAYDYPQGGFIQVLQAEGCHSINNNPSRGNRHHIPQETQPTSSMGLRTAATESAG